MDVTALLDSLNDAQRQAVSAPPHAMLILAGAGSGKTRVLVHRIAWKIQVEGVSPYSILAVTFTNKAAQEMRGRVESLLQLSASSMWIGTFHGIAHRLLRRHWQQANLAETFQVMDSDDQLRVIKRIIKAKEDDENEWLPQEILGFINDHKEEGRRSHHIYDTGDFVQSTMLTFYKEYEEVCNRCSLVDFAELLLRVHEMLRDNPPLLEHYQHRFREVLVDEFQDTNTIQYAWLRLLTEGKDNLFVVGDDDQSIYSWRGAKVEHIYKFQQDYPNHQLIRLEQNYRSTLPILNAANRLIEHNQYRMGKNLWTDAKQGELITLYEGFSDRAEADFVTQKIKEFSVKGLKLSDMAILYRSSHLSRLFEDYLIKEQIPYRIYGGLRFFERKEIKDLLAYLRLMVNRRDDSSLERIINLPTRGIGEKTLSELRTLAQKNKESLWDSIFKFLNQKKGAEKTKGALHSFVLLIKTLSDTAKTLALHEQITMVIEHAGLIEFYEKEKDGKGEDRLDNLKELVTIATWFKNPDENENEENLSELDMFLAYAVLESGEMQAKEGEDCVQLMTLHKAKGLEFNTVFLVGMEENIFPSEKSTSRLDRLEEERRLCYVGITRAMQHLFISYAESRWFYGKERRQNSSRFLKEIPSELMQEIRIRAQITRPASVAKAKAADSLKTNTYKAGQKVSHVKFGQGVVLQTEGEGTQEKVQINFKTAGMKWLMLAYAKLDVIS